MIEIYKVIKNKRVRDNYEVLKIYQVIKIYKLAKIKNFTKFLQLTLRFFGAIIMKNNSIRGRVSFLTD